MGNRPGFSMEDVDRMDGFKFEEFCASILVVNGYTDVSVTRATGDKGIDVIAEFAGVTYAVQCKRYNSLVGIKAAQEAYSGAAYYHRMYGVIMTNSHFTDQAREFANQVGVKLCDREMLDDMMKKGFPDGYRPIVRRNKYSPVLKIFIAAVAALLFICLGFSMISNGIRKMASYTSTENSEQTETIVDGLKYDISDEYAVLLGLADDSEVTVVNVPAEVSGKPITKIMDSAFYRTDITEVILPDSVTEIGRLAFEACSSLTKVDFGWGVVSIGEKAFCDTAITRLELPDATRSIGAYAFSACFELETVTLSEWLESDGI